jgi:hypothetical protein
MSEKVLNILSNTELLLTSFSTEQWLLWAKENKGKNIFFGIGLMTSSALSEAVPFDVLAMFFLAELIRKIVEAEKVFVLVADQHAITNQLLPLEKIQEITQNTLATIASINQAFDLNHFEVIQTTPLNFDERIKTIYRNLPNITNDYLKHEIADTLWLQKHHGVGIKLGWAMSTEQAVQGHDERFFDAQIAQFSAEMAFIHAKPGRTGRPERQRVSPYVSVAGEERLLLRPDEDVISKMRRWRSDTTNVAVKPLLRHVSQIIRLHDRLFVPVGQMSLEEKVQTLISNVSDIRK